MLFHVAPVGIQASFIHRKQLDTQGRGSRKEVAEGVVESGQFENDDYVQENPDSKSW